MNVGSIWEQLTAILGDSVGFVYRLLPRLMEAEREYASHDEDVLQEWACKGLIGIYAFCLLPISLLMPTALCFFIAGIDHHAAHIQTSYQYKLSDIEYAKSLLPVLVEKQSYIKPEYNVLKQEWTIARVTLKTSTQIHYARNSREFYQMRTNMRERYLGRSEEIYQQYRQKLHFPSLPQQSPPLLPSNKVIFVHVLANYLVEMNTETRIKERDSKQKGEWKSSSPMGYLWWTIFIVPIGGFCWLRFWILSGLLLLFTPLPSSRREALVEYSHETRFTWYRYLVVYLLFPVLFGLLYLALSGFSLPEDIQSIIQIFSSEKHGYESVFLVSMIIGLMISTSFYRALHWLCRGLLIGVLGYNHPIVSFVICNLLSVIVLLSIRVSLPLIGFALFTSVYLALHPKLFGWLKEKLG